MSRRHVALFVLLCALWGFSFVALKVALRHVDPIFLGSIRYWLPGFLVLGFCAVIRRPIRIPARRLPAVALLGVVNTGLLTLFLNLGQREISAALGSILLYTYPLMAAIVSPIFLGEHIDRWKVAGIAVGFGGILLVAGFGGHASALGVAYVLLGAASWAVGTVIFKRIIPEHDVFTLTAWQLLFGAIFMSIVSAAVEGVPHADFTANVWLAYLWLTIPGMAVAGTLWYWLLERGEAAVASAYMFMTPVFGVFFGWVVLSEDLGWTQLAGGLLVAVSIYLVNRTAAATAEPTRQPAQAAALSPRISGRQIG
ncbi:MAG: DMT family transporter [Actinomycetota bacterium]